MRFPFILLFIWITQTAVFGQIDNDSDGMSDEWEMKNGLDNTDPTDAYCDNDGDQVINLFEFQLDTDPHFLGSPKIVEKDKSVTSDELNDLIQSSGNEPVVIRLSEGKYDT